jgi:hypothetical protein
MLDTKLIITSIIGLKPRTLRYLHIVLCGVGVKKNFVPGQQYRVGKVVLNRCTQHGTAIWKSFGDLPMYPYKYFHGEVILHLRN